MAAPRELRARRSAGCDARLMSEFCGRKRPNRRRHEEAAVAPPSLQRGRPRLRAEVDQKYARLRRRPKKHFNRADWRQRPAATCRHRMPIAYEARRQRQGRPSFLESDRKLRPKTYKTLIHPPRRPRSCRVMDSSAVPHNDSARAHVNGKHSPPVRANLARQEMDLPPASGSWRGRRAGRCRPACLEL